MCKKKTFLICCFKFDHDLDVTQMIMWQQNTYLCGALPQVYNRTEPQCHCVNFHNTPREIWEGGRISTDLWHEVGKRAGTMGIDNGLKLLADVSGNVIYIQRLERACSHVKHRLWPGLTGEQTHSSQIWNCNMEIVTQGLFPAEQWILIIPGQLARTGSSNTTMGLENWIFENWNIYSS